MKKNYKRIYGYAVIMVVCVLIIVLIACLSENRIADYQNQYEEDMTISQKQILTLEEKISALEKEKSELEKQLKEKMTLGSDLVTSQQTMADLKEIYEKYKSGNTAQAKAALDRIEPIGFDDMTLAYYEILSDILNK